MNTPENHSRHPIAYTVGEPAGIGADIIIQLAQQENLSDIVVVGDQEHLQHRAEQLSLSLPDSLQIHHVPIAKSNTTKVPAVENIDGVLDMLNTAIDGCLSGHFSAMVTGPLHKGIINDAGINFSGHTEYLAERTNAPLPVMMLATRALRVALVTTHLPLKDVATAISEDLVIQICQIIDHDLRHKYGIENPKLLVCGLTAPARYLCRRSITSRYFIYTQISR